MPTVAYMEFMPSGREGGAVILFLCPVVVIALSMSGKRREYVRNVFSPVVS